MTKDIKIISHTLESHFKKIKMKQLYHFSIILLVFMLGCNKKEVIINEENTSNIIENLEYIEILSGNNQVGYIGATLEDSLKIKIRLKKMDDIEQYGYCFKSSDLSSRINYTSYISGDDLIVSAKWELGSRGEPEQLIFYLTENCVPSNCNCNQLDSLKFSATVKKKWEETNSYSNITLHDIHFTDENNGLIVGEFPFNSGYLRTDDAGLSWSLVENNRRDLYQIYFSDRDTGIVIITNNYALSTADGGRSFQQGNWTPPIIGHLSSKSYYMINSKNILSVGRRGEIAKTTNAGESWLSYQGFTFENQLNNIICIDEQTCYACGEIGKIIKSNDAGDTWHEQELMSNSNLQTICFLDDDYGFIGGQNGTLARTNNGGENWEILSTEILTTIIEITFKSPQIIYALSSGGAIARSEDGGNTWKLIMRDFYGVERLNKVIIKDNTAIGLQYGSIYKIDLNDL